MKIGIYNRYWQTRGGGERYAGVIAECLCRDHQVDLLGVEPVDVASLGEHLGLDLGGTHFVLLPAVGERQLAAMTRSYDLFVNCTYLSKLPSEARRSIYLVLFPQRAWPAAVLRAARTSVRLLTPSASSAVVQVDGFHFRDWSGSSWSQGRFSLKVAAEAFRGGCARLRFAVPGRRSLADSILDVEAPGMRWHVDGRWLVLKERDGQISTPVEVTVRCHTVTPAAAGVSKDTRRLGLAFVGVGRRRPWSRLSGLMRRVEGLVDGHDPAIPGAYDLVLSISQFTRSWVSKRWKVASEVLAPPVDTRRFATPGPAAKGKTILSVGRFFHGSHNKKHVEMLQVFRAMHDRGEVPPGWEYHLVGNVHRGRPQDRRYIARVEALAEGYPVKVLTDLDLDTLVDEYRRASIFWHAAGWGEDERRVPEKLEHFGITTCEAMSAGCIPVVIAKAGQLEIVEPGESGFLFADADELRGHTRSLMDGFGEPWVAEMSRRAVAAVQRFDKDRFAQHFHALLVAHDLLDRPAGGEATGRDRAADPQEVAV